MKKVKKVLLWIVTVLFCLLAIGSFPGAAGFVGLLTVVLIIPIDKWQQKLKSFLKGKIKSILAVALAIITLVTLPNVETESPILNDASITSATTSTSQKVTVAVDTSTTVQPKEESSDVMESTTTSTTISTTTKITTTTAATTTKKPVTTTTTQKITTTTKAPTTTTQIVTTIATRVQYVLNTHTKKFHKLSCSRLPTDNREDTTMSRDEIIGLGYSPCGFCDP